MKPDLKLFIEHIEGAEFQTGVDKEMWGIVGEESPQFPAWPKVIIWISAAKKVNSPDKYYFQFDLSNYPESAPTACPWNITQNQRLEDSFWPRGSKFVSATFNPGWNKNALYAPCDRVAMVGHGNWQAQWPDLWWQSSFKINVYLYFIHRLLNSGDYANS